MTAKTMKTTTMKKLIIKKVEMMRGVMRVIMEVWFRLGLRFIVWKCRIRRRRKRKLRRKKK